MPAIAPPAADRGIRLPTRFLLAIAGCLIFAGGAFAQLPQARVTTVFPPGGERGTSFDVSVGGGADLDEATQLYFSHPGISAVLKTQMVDGKPQPQFGQFTVSVAPDVPVGPYDVRVRGLFGLSNPRTFVVGDRHEINEVEPNNTPDKPMPVALDTVINGRSDGGADLDYYKFSAKAGQRVVVTVRARKIDSRMDGTLELYDAAGRRLARSNPRRTEEPLIDFAVPADGEYVVKVFDFVYGGGAEYPYRLLLRTGPWIDFVIPASGLPGTTSEYTLYGRNLPGGQPSTVTIDGRPLDQLKVQISLPADDDILEVGEQFAPAEAVVDGIAYRLDSPTGASNTVTIYAAAAPTAVEQEPNDAADKPQLITLPVEITGQFQARGDVDLYQFDAKAGDVYWIEAFGQRSGTEADPVLVVDQVKKDDKGQETLTRITAVDDTATNIGGNTFNTVTDDPVFRFAAPSDGTFRVTLRDRTFESQGGAEFVYRLTIHKERPDFRLVAAPMNPSTDPNQQATTWDLGLRRGDNDRLTVMAFRRDGFNGTIDVTAEGLPQGVTCPGASIGPNQVSTTLLFSSTENAPIWFGNIRIVGKARIEDPATAKAITDAEAALKAAVAALAPLDKALADAQTAAKAAQDAVAAATAAFEKDQNNADLKKAKEDADAALAQANQTTQAATTAKAAGDTKRAEAESALASAQVAHANATRDVAREARAGTVVWSGNPGAQQPAVARVARTVTLAVMKETAPYQLTLPQSRFEVNQSSQILLPFKLLKRNGFDNNVNLTFVGPPQNVQVENKPINKGTDNQVYRLFVQNNAPVGSYTVLVQTTGQVSYSRNPEAAAAAAKEKEEVDKLVAELTEALKKANEAKAAAEKAVPELQANLKAAQDGKPAADKLAADTAAAAKAAAEAKIKADKEFADADVAAKTATDELAKAMKAAGDAETAEQAAGEKAAKAKADLGADADNETLKKALADAEAAAQAAFDALKKAREVRAVAEQKLPALVAAQKKTQEAKAAADKSAAETAEAAKKAAEAQAANAKTIAETEVALKQAMESKAQSEKLAGETDQQLKQATARKQVTDKRATDTANASKPQNVNMFSPAAAITIVIKQGPGTLAVNAPNNGALKRGEKLEVKVTVNRANGFAGPVTLTLPLPPGVAGLNAAPVTVPAEANEGVLVIEASADATMGQLANMVVRAEMDFNGRAAIDQPIALNVAQ
jgi:hypothetical protein